MEVLLVGSGLERIPSVEQGVVVTGQRLKIVTIYIDDGCCFASSVPVSQSN